MLLKPRVDFDYFLQAFRSLEMLNEFMRHKGYPPISEMLFYKWKERGQLSGSRWMQILPLVSKFCCPENFCNRIIIEEEVGNDN